MAIQKEIWAKYLVSKLFKANPHLRLAMSHDEYVLAGKVVHIPQSGAPNSVVKNRSSFPATAVRRTDTDLTYNLDEYSIDPTHIQDAEKYEVSYNKIDSVIGDSTSQLVETVGDDMLIKWASGITGAGIIRTSGGLTAALTGNQTGSRRVLVHGDIQKIATKMNLQNVPRDGRYLMLESNHMDQLKTSLSDSQYRDFSSYFDAKNGIVGRLHGFDILERTTVLMLTSADVVNPLGASSVATDCVGSLAFQKDCVVRALGEVKTFEKKDDPQYFGDIYSALLRMGGRRNRADDAGVIELVQAAS